MNFIDNTGHTFSLPSYSSKPIGYEYQNPQYIFWMDNDKTKQLSVNNYYCKILQMLIPVYPINFKDEDFNCDIVCDSKIYKLVSTLQIQNMISNKSSISDLFENHININEETDLKTKLTSDDLISVKIDETNDNQNSLIEIPSEERKTSSYVIVPIYIVGCAKEEGMWATNILVHVYPKEHSDYVDDEWTFFQVGGNWKEQSEILQINASNMGIKLPQDILKAVYQESFLNNAFNEELYNQKIKEYFLNYMGIKGETGNFSSAIKSLNFFGYGDKITISKLLKTDNQYQKQYVRDYFDIKSDILDSFKTFRNSTLISLEIKENYETGDYEKIDFSKQFTGEGLPKLKSYFDTNVKVEAGTDYTDTGYEQHFYYWKPYYDYCFYELALKLSALKYYYDKYFLPIHLNINSASITHKEYAVPIKFTITPKEYITEPILYNSDTNDVEFPQEKIQYFTHQVHYVDENFNEFEDIDENVNLYYINDTCLNVPIKFKKLNKYYNCVLLLSKQTSRGYDIVYESHFSIYQTNDKNTYRDFTIYPKYLAQTNTDIIYNKLDKKIINQIGWWNNSVFRIQLLANNKWYQYDFLSKLQDINFELGTLSYKYNNSKFTQLSNLTDNSVTFNSFMFEPSLVTVNHFDYYKDLIKYCRLSNSKYFDGNLITNNDFYKYIYYNGIKINISNELFGKTITINKNAVSDEYVTEYKIFEDVNLNKITSSDKVLKISDSDDTISLTFDKTLYKYIDNKNNQYTIYSQRHSNIEKLLNKYIEEKHITLNSKYLNRIHIFDIYKQEGIQEKEVSPYSFFKTNSEMEYDGIVLKHDSPDDLKIHISGSFNSDLENIDEKNWSYTNTFAHHADSISSLNPNIDEVFTAFGYYTFYDGKQYTYETNYSKIIDGVQHIGIYNEVNEDDVHYVGQIPYYNDIKLTTHSVYRYKYKNSNNFVTNSTPSLYWYDVDNSKTIVDPYDNDIYQSWVSADALAIGQEDFQSFISDNPSRDEKNKYGDIDLNTLDNFNKQANRFVQAITLKSDLYKLYSYSNTSHVRLLYWLNKDYYKTFNNDSYLYLTDNIVDYDKFTKNNTANNVTYMYYKSGYTLFAAIEMDKYDTSGNPIDYSKLNAFIAPSISKKIGTEKFVKLKYSDKYKGEPIIGETSVGQYKYNEFVQNQNTIDLYNEFFYKDADTNNITQSKALSISKNIDYDFYLMHDNDYWYGIYISPDTINHYTQLSYLLYVPNVDNNYDFSVFGLSSFKQYFFKYNRSGNEFLINRMKFNSSSGINHFLSTDIVVSNITNNYRLPFNLNIQSKYIVTPISLGLSKQTETKSNTEMAIINIPSNNNVYIKGYYDIKLNYSLDSFSGEHVLKQQRMRIDKDSDELNTLSEIMLNQTNSIDKNKINVNNDKQLKTTMSVFDAINKESFNRYLNDTKLSNLLRNTTIVYDTTSYITNITNISSVKLVVSKIENGFTYIALSNNGQTQYYSKDDYDNLISKYNS